MTMEFCINRGRAQISWFVHFNRSVLLDSLLRRRAMHATQTSATIFDAAAYVVVVLIVHLLTFTTISEKPEREFSFSAYYLCAEIDTDSLSGLSVGARFGHLP